MLSEIPLLLCCFFRLDRSRYDKALIVLQDFKPVLDIGGIVSQAAGGFKPCVAHKGSSPDSATSSSLL